MTTTHDQFDLGTVAKAAMAARAATKLALPARLGLGLVGTAQLVFAFLAFWDLAIRDKDSVKGPKPVWIPVLFVNWIGPAAYFLFGIKR